MKPAAVVIGGVSLAAAIAPAFTELLPVPPQPLLIVAVAAAQAALLVIWLARITPEWVRAAGFAYAQRLLAACDVL